MNDTPRIPTGLTIVVLAAALLGAIVAFVCRESGTSLSTAITAGTATMMVTPFAAIYLLIAVDARAQHRNPSAI